MFYNYCYKKATKEHPYPGQFIPHYLKLLPVLIATLGLGLLASVAWPIISYEITSFSFFRINSLEPGLISPLSDENSVLAQGENEPEIVSDIDYSKASNWFTFTSDEQRPTPITTHRKKNSTSDTVLSPIVDYFSLSIPSLKIDGASVKVDGEDLSKSLVHYPGTALPGEFGSPVIFGHSALPQFFNPQNYMTIFATLPTIQVGADIFVTIDKVTYTYRVAKLFQIKPNETWALRQLYDQKTLKLVTCVPPGTRLRRLIVEANLVEST